MIQAKILKQELWQQKREWDEPLPTEFIIKWHDIAMDIQEATKTVVPGCYFPSNTSSANSTQLHVFVHPGSMAYGAAA